ncbi:MAG: DUF2125 domain-containing protein [Paracoccaceae bacterium]
MPFSRSVSALAVMTAMLGTPVFADLTADDVWADWQAYMKGFGYDMRGAQTRSGDTLKVRDVVMQQVLADDQGMFQIKMDVLTFVETGDGAVRVDLPSDMPIAFDMKPIEGPSISGQILYSQDTPSMVVTGDVSDLTYTYSANGLTVSMDGLTMDGVAMPAEAFRMRADLRDVANVTRIKSGALRDYSQDLTAGAVTYDVTFDIPDPEAGKGFLRGTATNLQSDWSGTLPDDIDAATDLGAMIEAGFDVRGSVTFDGGTSEVDMLTPDGPFALNTSSQGGAVRVGMGTAGLSYDFNYDQVSATAKVAEFPFPVTVGLGKFAFKLQAPVQQVDTEQDFALGLTLGDFTISEVIWNLFDPAAQLPRDPATIALDLTGKAKILLDFLNPDIAQTLKPNQMPAEVNSVTLNNLQISAAGADLTGMGAFSFDNTDTNSFGGVPKPSGALDLRLQGANGLIDSLVKMGLLPEDQAMGARMMMGLFTVPQGDDVLSSKIEVNDQGHVLANGQRLR